MAHSGDGTGWSETTPAGTEPIYLGALEIRDLRKGLNLRIKKEHVIMSATTGGAEHKSGSAMAYALATASAPTLRPDAATSFTSADIGRVWYDTTLNVLKILVSVGAVTWETVGIPKDTIMFFYANDASALPGWTIYNTVVDCVLALKGGSGAYNVTGGDGAEKGAWTHNHGTNTGNVKLTSAQSGVPSHTHWLSTPTLSSDDAGSGKVTVGGSATEGVAIVVAANTAADAASNHAHTVTAETTFRPLAAVGILAKKD